MHSFGGCQCPHGSANVWPPDRHIRCPRSSINFWQVCIVFFLASSPSCGQGAVTTTNPMALRGGGIDLPGGLKYLSEEAAKRESARHPLARTTAAIGAGLQEVQTATAKSILFPETGFGLLKEEDIVLEKNVDEDRGVPNERADVGKTESREDDIDLEEANGFKIREEVFKEDFEMDGYVEEILEEEGVSIEQDEKGRIWHHYDLSRPGRADPQAGVGAGAKAGDASLGLGKRRGQSQREHAEDNRSSVDREAHLKRARMTQPQPQGAADCAEHTDSLFPRAQAPTRML